MKNRKNLSIIYFKRETVSKRSTKELKVKILLKEIQRFTLKQVE